MNLFKSKILLCVLSVIIVIAGCETNKNEMKLLDVKPKDFNFVLNYGYGMEAKNQINTIEGKFTKDMVVEPSITTDLTLSNEDMNSIYLEMRKINVLSYPEKFNPSSNMMQTPFETYSIKIVANGKEKNIYWKDENASKTEEAVQLRELFNKIKEIIYDKKEYKNLPNAKSGYM